MSTQAPQIDSKIASAVPTANSKPRPYSTLSSIMDPLPVPSNLDIEEKFRRCSAVCDNGGECVQPQELRKLLETKPHPICYDGFEPSGRMHLAQGVLKAMNVNRLTSSGCVFVFWVADWFALLNNKMGGDLDKIKTVGKYFIEVWKAVGMNMDNVRFLWASDEINKNPTDYWLRVMNVSRASSISRVKRCGQIMGRSDGDEQPAAQIMYPCMQCADVFYLHADICQLGLDQRKVNMLAREFADKLEFHADKRQAKPVILSHAMMPGLLEGQEKMSKSDPDSAIFMEDSVEDVNRKIKKAYCPPQILESNPCITYLRQLVFPLKGEFSITRKEANGGDRTFTSIEELEAAYLDGSLHPGDLKPALAVAINAMIEPVRTHFKTNEDAKKLLATIKRYQAAK